MDPVRPQARGSQTLPGTPRVPLLRLHKRTLTPGSTGLEPHGLRLKPQGRFSLITRENPDLRAWTASKSLRLSSGLGRLGCVRNGPTAGDKKTHTSWFMLKMRGQVGTVGSSHRGVLKARLAARLLAAGLCSEMPTGLAVPPPHRWASSSGPPGGSLAPDKLTYENQQNTKASATRLGSKQNSASLCGWLR